MSWPQPDVHSKFNQDNAFPKHEMDINGSLSGDFVTRVQLPLGTPNRG
jgi:hypothetical protein